MPTTAVDATVLTSEDVKAIQKADKIVLRHYEGVATIEAALDGGWGDTPRIYTAAEQRLYPAVGHLDNERARYITVTGSVSFYGEHASRRLDEKGSGFQMFSSAQYSNVWSTVASLMRAGDVIGLAFEGDGYTNDIVRKSGLHADTLYVHINRAGLRKPLTILVSSTVGYDNSARMVKRGTYSLSTS